MPKYARRLGLEDMKKVIEGNLVTFVCVHCGHVWEQNVLVERHDDEKRHVDYKGEEIICPECSELQPEEAGLESYKDRIEELRLDWVENSVERRKSTSCMRKGLYPEHRDEKGYIEETHGDDEEIGDEVIFNTPLSITLGLPRFSRRETICYAKSGIGIDWPGPLSGIISAPGRSRILSAVRFGRDWTSWRFARKVLKHKDKIVQTIGWLEVIVSSSVLDKEDLKSLDKAVKVSLGKREILRHAKIWKWEDFLLSLDEMGISPALAGIDTPTIMSFAKTRIPVEALGFKLVCFPQGEDWTGDEAYIISAGAPMPEGNEIQVVKEI